MYSVYLQHCQLKHATLTQGNRFTKCLENLTCSTQDLTKHLTQTVLVSNRKPLSLFCVHHESMIVFFVLLYVYIATALALPWHMQ